MSQSVNIVSAEDSIMNVDDSTAAEVAFDSTSCASAPRVLGGLILPPETLLTELPEVASAVNNAIRSSTRTRRTPVYLQPELTPHTTQHFKRQHTPTYKKRAQHIAQKNLMLVESSQRKKKVTQNLRQYQRKFKCYICNLQFPTKEELISHNQLNHQHKCDDCKIEYSTKEQLQDHNCLFCKICNKLYEGTYSIHCRKYHHKPNFICYACDEHFNNEDRLTVYQESYVAFYGNCPQCDRRFTSFLCYECGDSYRSKVGISKHIHSHCSNSALHKSCQPGLENSCNICNEEFEHDFLLASHMRTHSSTVKSYTKTPKINGKTKDIENQEIKDSEDKVEANEKWFDNAKETFYKADGEMDSIKDLGNDWSIDAVKQEPDDIKICDDATTNVLDESKLDKRRTDGVKNEQQNWYEVNIEPTEIYFVSEVQRQKHQRTIIICDNTENMNENTNNSLYIIKEEPSDYNQEY